MLMLTADLQRAQMLLDWGDAKHSVRALEEKTRAARRALAIAGVIAAGWSTIQGLRKGKVAKSPGTLKMLAQTLLPTVFRLASRAHAR